MKWTLKYNIYLYILSCCILYSIGLQGQSMYAVNYTFKDGLPSDEVYWIEEASDGLLWVGCDKGLVSFDGVSFKKYKVPKARNKSITGIFEDSNGTIWCHNFAGQIYYIYQGELHLLESWERAGGGKAINSLVMENDVLRIESFFKAWLYDIATGSLEKAGNRFFILNNGNKLFLDGITGTSFEKNGEKVSYYCPECFFIPLSGRTLGQQPRMSFAKSEGMELLYVHNYFGRDWQNAKGKLKDKGTKAPFVFLVKEDSLKALYFPQKIAKYGINFIINKMKIIDENNLYLSTSEGLFIWNIITNKVRHFFKGKVLNDSFFDKEGNFWLGSTEKGLFFVPRLTLRLHDKLIKNKVIYQIETDQHGNVLMGYDDGSIRYWNPTTDEILFEKAFPIKKRIQNIVYNEREDEYWIATQKRAHIFYPQRLEIAQKKELGSSIYDMAFDTLGNVSTALGHGAYLMTTDTANQETIKLPKPWEDKPSWANYKRQVKGGFSGYLVLVPEGNRTYSTLFQKVPEYTVWVGSVSKLLYYCNGIQTEVKDKKGARIIATCLEEENDSTFWVGTLEDGLYCIQNRAVIKHIKIKREADYNEIQELKINNNILWAVSTSGIIRYDLAIDSMTIWDKGNGLPSWNIFDIAFVKDQIYVATRDGLVSMPTNLKMEAKKTLVKMTQLIVNDSLYPLQSAYQLEPYENTLKIEFKGISFRSQNNFRYEYRLLGVEKNWNNVSSANNLVNYPDLSPGNYTFQAVFIKTDGSRSEPLNISFVISAPFYTKWWFIVLVGAFIIMVISWIYKKQITKIKDQNEEKLERSRLERDIRISELKALKAQLNPHFMFNALNSIQDYIIQNERELASDYLGMFSDLMRLYLNHSQEGQLSLKEEIDSLKLYLELEAIRMDVNFSYSIQVAEGLDIHETEIPTMLVQPYVENAIKHGLFGKKGAKKIDITFKQPHPSFILAIVRDNGIGRTAAAKTQKHQLNRHKSFATAANNSRLELLNYGRAIPIKAEILDLMDGAIALGTEVQISIPIKERG